MRIPHINNPILVRFLQGVILLTYPSTYAFQQKAASCCQSLKSVLGYQRGVALYLVGHLKMTMTYKTLGRVCLVLSVLAPIGGNWLGFESSGWTFFMFLGFAVLFHSLDEQAENIEALRSPKEDSEEWKEYAKKKRELEANPRSNDPFYISDESKEFKKESDVVFFKKNPEIKKRLMFLISTKDKTSQQSTQEVMGAYQKYEQTEKKVKPKSRQKKNSQPTQNNDKKRRQ